MPRPKVPSHQRQRAASACNYCRASKKRCSATVPCTACVRRGIADICTLSSDRASLRGDRNAPLRRQYEHAGRTPKSGVSQIGNSSDVAPSVPISPSDSHVDDDSGTTNEGPSPPIRQLLPRILLNLQGERVFIGGSASISFLQLVREVVTDQIGPSGFSHNASRNNMLEVEPTQPDPDVTPENPELTLEERMRYGKTFFTATAGVVEMFSLSEIESIMQSYEEATSCECPFKRALVDLIIAIGAQCESLESARDVGRVYFKRAQSLVFKGMLQDPNAGMMSAFILMAFYFLGECRRNTAFIYIGIAVRTGVALGLHSLDAYVASSDQHQQAFRFRAWISVCTLDMLVSAILGRPPATTGSRFQSLTNHPVLTRMVENVSISLLASFDILCIITETVDELYGKPCPSTALVEQYLQRMDSWSQQLPESLRAIPNKTTSSELPQEIVVRNIHVSSLYYFGVTLVTRPILISILTSNHDLNTQPVTQLTAACIDASVYLIQTCAEAHKLNLLLGNLCIMKALIFATGLILGFFLFGERNTQPEVEDSFQKAMDLLRFLGVQSPQAAHYSEILRLLDNAITSRRKTAVVLGSNKYVGRIFSMDTTGSGSQEILDSGESSIAVEPSGQGVDAVKTPIQLLAYSDIDFDALSGWDALDLSEWDSFPFPNAKQY